MGDGTSTDAQGILDELIVETASAWAMQQETGY